MPPIRLRAVLLAALLVIPADVLRADDRVEIVPDVVYGHKAGMGLTFDVLKPKENANGVGVLAMMSGGWVSRWFPPEEILRRSRLQEGRFAALVNRGYTVFMVWHGSSPRFKVPEAVQDVRRAVRFVRRHAERFGVDPDRLGVFGASAGGHLALVLGTTPDEGDPDSDDPVERTPSRVAAVVAYFAPVDLRNSVGPNERFPALEFDPELAESVSPIAHVSSDDAATLLIHGDADDLVPIRHSRRIHAALKENGVPVELIVIEGAAHGFRGQDAQRAARAQVDWFDKHLRK
ncbi:MAG: alpha/beta hydrolase family protein [Pirellulales bacterium]